MLYRWSIYRYSMKFRQIGALLLAGYTVACTSGEIQEETTTSSSHTVDTTGAQPTLTLIRDSTTAYWKIIYTDKAQCDTLNTQIRGDSARIQSVQLDGTGMEEVLLSVTKNVQLGSYIGGETSWSHYEIQQVQSFWSLESQKQLCSFTNAVNRVRAMSKSGSIQYAFWDTCFYRYDFAIIGANEIKIDSAVFSNKRQCKKLQPDYTAGRYFCKSGKLQQHLIVSDSVYGIWTLDPNGPHADFVLDEQVYYRVDATEEEQLSHKLSNDTLFLFDHDYTDTLLIIKACNDSLVFNTVGYDVPFTYTRWKN